MALPVHPAEDIVVGSKLKAGEQLTSAAAVESKPSKRKASAVLVIHGMGQQVRFQPLEGVVEGMRRFGGCGDVKAGSLKVDGFDALQRIETSVDSQPVDFYEAYWSPMTEGQVNLKDVVEFLRGGAINGFIRGLSDYFRWIYQRAEKYPIPISTPFQLAAALAVVLALIGINLLSTAVLAGQSFLPVSDDLLKDLSALLGVIAVNAIFLGSILGAARGFRILKPGPFVRHRVEFAGGAGIYQVILGIVLGGWTMGISVLFYAKAKHPEVLALVPRGTVIAIGVIGVLLAVIPRSPARKVGLALYLTGLAIEMADVVAQLARQAMPTRE